MDTGVLVVIGALFVIGALAIGASGSSIQTFGGMFRAPTLGWPSGVQEDDDLQWTWSPAVPAAAVPAAAVPRRTEPEVVDTQPELVDVEPGSVGLRLQPIHRGVR